MGSFGDAVSATKFWICITVSSEWKLY
jgi:hypothetical protein